MKLWNFLKNAMLQYPEQTVCENGAEMAYEDLVVFSESFSKTILSAVMFLCVTVILKIMLCRCWMKMQQHTVNTDCGKPMHILSKVWLNLQRAALALHQVQHTADSIILPTTATRFFQLQALTPQRWK